MSDSTKLHFLCIVGPKKERKKTCRGCLVYIVGSCYNIHVWFCKYLHGILWYCSHLTRNLQRYYTILESQSKMQCVWKKHWVHMSCYLPKYQEVSNSLTLCGRKKRNFSELTPQTRFYGSIFECAACWIWTFALFCPILVPSELLNGWYVGFAHILIWASTLHKTAFAWPYVQVCCQ